MLTLFASSTAMSLMLISWRSLKTHSSSTIITFNMMKIENCPMYFSFISDYMSRTYSICILLISTAVMMFTMFYMKGSENYRQFNFMTILFISSMITFVFSENFITMMIGWDGLGITSFCLVIYYNSANSLSSGLLTMITNRLGDSIFLSSMFFFLESGMFSINQLKETSTMFWTLLLIGSMTKSAQIPFSSWLPAAMAAPTPISSLVHSSTLVTAGVFLMIRYNFVFHLNKTVVSSLCLMTMFISSTAACWETDLKKLIALSTLSQLGMMMFLMSMGLWKMSFMHMTFHAIFKSSMFLSAGGLIYSSIGNQESRTFKKGHLMKTSWVLMLTSCLSLAGFPFSFGFYSKDTIISTISPATNTFTYYLFMFSCVLTVVYSMRYMTLPKMMNNNTESMNKAINSTTHFLSYQPLMLICLPMGYNMFETMTETTILLRSTDLLYGLLILTMGLSMKSPLTSKILMKKTPTFWFLTWLSSGGITLTMKKFFMWSIERSWMEIVDKISTPLNHLKFYHSEKFTNPSSFLTLMLPLIILFIN